MASRSTIFVTNWQASTQRTLVHWLASSRCFVTTILKTKEERDEDVKKILRGEPVNGESVNKVKDVPQGFKEWVQDNAERIDKARTLPYFIKDKCLSKHQTWQNSSENILPAILNCNFMET